MRWSWREYGRCDLFVYWWFDWGWLVGFKVFGVCRICWGVGFFMFYFNYDDFKVEWVGLFVGDNDGFRL